MTVIIIMRAKRAARRIRGCPKISLGLDGYLGNLFDQSVFTALWSGDWRLPSVKAEPTLLGTISRE